MDTNTIVWFLITGIITIALGTIGYFIKRTLDKIDTTLIKMNEAIDELRDYATRQDEKNKSNEKEIAEIWEAIDSNVEDIDDIKTKVLDFENIHKFCKNNKGNHNG